MKSGNRVWGTDKPTKTELIAFLSQNGFALEKSAPENVGHWNELVRWYAVNGGSRLELSVSMKAERPHWQHMIDAFDKFINSGKTA